MTVKERQIQVNFRTQPSFMRRIETAARLNGASVNFEMNNRLKASFNISTSHPLITTLFAMLPPQGAEWPKHERGAFLRACDGIFEVLYKDENKTGPTK